MLVKALAENTSVSDNIKSEHGLSLYVEAGRHRLLFDTGAGSLFAENAATLGIDLASIDTVVLSHGHSDHGGGLKTFIALNQTATIYARENAFEPYYANKPTGERAFIGLDRLLLAEQRFVLTGARYAIDEELMLFSNVRGERFNPTGNIDLLKKWGAGFQRDDFSHEQNLVIRENGRIVLLAGCAHSGIVNILEQLKSELGLTPDAVIGGFHLFNPNNKKSEDPAVVDGVGRYLLETGAKYYTCHCTGLESYARLKAVMGGSIDYLSGGGEISI